MFFAAYGISPNILIVDMVVKGVSQPDMVDTGVEVNVMSREMLSSLEVSRMHRYRAKLSGLFRAQHTVLGKVKLSLPNISTRSRQTYVYNTYTTYTRNINPFA